MKRSRWVLIVLPLLLPLGGVWAMSRSRPVPSSAAPVATASVQFKTYDLPQAVVRTLVIPQGAYEVVPARSLSVNTVAEFAVHDRAIAVLNGGFFDPKNQKTTSFITLQGKLVADPRQNPHLMENPDLSRYLDKILDRSEFRRYQCAQAVQYDITSHRAAVPTGCRLLDALGAGPQLLPIDTSEAEGFIDVSEGRVIRDALGSRRANARTAIGLMPTGEIIWVMVAQKPGTESGLSLPDLAQFLRSQGVSKALNLDGGSSSALFYEQKTYLGKLNPEGTAVERPVKSVLLLRSLK